MEEYDDLFDEEYDLWQEELDNYDSEYFDNQIDEIYQQHLNDYYKSYEDRNLFVLIYNTSSKKEYIVPGTNIRKTETYENNKLKTTTYYKDIKMQGE